jgi:hypothetical protein
MKGWAGTRASEDKLKIKFSALIEIEPQFSGRPARSLVPTPTEPQKLSKLMKKENYV